MALVVNTNIASLNSQRNLGISNSQLGKSLEKLSSGLRINKAADDAAGLAIATKFGAQVRGLNQAVRNANNAISLVQTAEGGVNTLTNVLQRLRELAVQSSSDDNTASDRATLTSEASNLISEFTRVATTTEFNTMSLMDGTFTGKYFQVGANYSQMVTFDLGDARGKSLGGRAQYDANVVDGVINSVNGNFGGSEVKVNGYSVAATSSSDDQYSVLELAAGSISNVAAGNSGTYSLMINNTTVVFTLSNGDTAASVQDVVVSAINAAKITNVSAYTLGSTYVIKAGKGVDLELAASLDTGTLANALSGLGLSGFASMFGSIAASGSDVFNANGQSSALAKAVAINTVKSNSGVTATARPNGVTGTAAVAAGTISSGDIYINGVNIGAVTIAASDSTGALVSAINGNSSATGVTASTDADGKLILTAADGRNMTVTTKNTAIRGYLNIDSAYFTFGQSSGGNSAVFRAGLRLTSENAISLTGNLGDLFDKATNDGTTTVADKTTKTTVSSKSVAVDGSSYNVAALDISSQDSSQSAILTIDAALNDLNDLRSKIGAIQNRIEFTVSNLETASENMSASESRIKDADFAYETARFTRNQILVQAGTAMLAQANTLQQVALQLLK